MKFESGSCSQNGNPTCVTCGKRHYEKCLAGTSGCFGYGKDDHKVRDCETIIIRGIECNQVAPNVLKDDAPNKRHLYALHTSGAKRYEDDDDFGK